MTLRRLKKEKDFYDTRQPLRRALRQGHRHICFRDGSIVRPRPAIRRARSDFTAAGARNGGLIAPGPAIDPGRAAKLQPARAILRGAERRLSRRLVRRAGRDARPDTLQRAQRKVPGAIVGWTIPCASAPSRSPASSRSAPRQWASRPPPRRRCERSPSTQPAPLVARRVPGVGPMPYERYGFSLLPAWNGQQTASWPPYTQQIAPAGTQWADQEADPARAGLASFDARAPEAAPPMASSQLPVTASSRRAAPTARQRPAIISAAPIRRRRNGRAPATANILNQ